MQFQTFWSKVQWTDSCWLWIAGKSKSGYGSLTYLGKRHSAHRFSYEICNECVLTPMQVIMHTCDIRACVNPKHLVLGSIKENNRDMFRKGRGCLSHRYGEKANGVKLTNAQISEIKKTPKTYGGAVKLAKKMEVSSSLVGLIQKGKHR